MHGDPAANVTDVRTQWRLNMTTTNIDGAVAKLKIVAAKKGKKTPYAGKEARKSKLPIPPRPAAQQAASAARKPGDGARLTDRLIYALAQVVMVRRVGDVAGDGPDAELARAERSVGDGDFDAAFAALDKLPPAAREAMSGWRVRAERRAEVDRLVAALRARALRDVAASGRGGP